MPQQSIVPGVQSCHDSDLHTGAFRVFHQFLESICGRVKQKISHILEITPPQLVEIVRNGESDMKMSDRQQFLVLFGCPGLLLRRGEHRPAAR